jgi:RNA polymerase sigma factor (sigma-70 family)
VAAVPSIGRANRVEGAEGLEAELTRELYEQYANQIFRYCLHQLGSREEAEDAVQSTFLNAFRGLRRGVVPELESAWLFKIAHNVCLSRRRSSWRRGRIESPADFELVEELTPAPARRAEELIGLQDVLEQMPESQRRAILLREWQGLSYREIAAELDVSQAAVETLIFRARRALASGLEQPPQPAPRRAFLAADLGNIFAGLKSLLLGGGAAIKVAAAVAVVGAASVAVAGPVVQHRHHSTPPAPATPPAKAPDRPAPAVVRPAAVARPVHHAAARVAHHAGKKPAPAPGRMKHLGVRPHQTHRATHGPAWRPAPAPASHGKAVRGAAAPGKTTARPVVGRGQERKAAVQATHAPPAAKPAHAKPVHMRLARSAQHKSPPAHVLQAPAQPARPPQAVPGEAGAQGQGQAKDNGKGKGA